MKRTVLFITLLFLAIGLKGSSSIILDTIKITGQIDYSFSKERDVDLNKSLMIINSHIREVGFEVSYNREDWQIFRLQPLENVVIDTKRFNRYFVKIWTRNEKFKSYQLQEGMRYVIKYDNIINMFVLNAINFE